MTEKKESPGSPARGSSGGHPPGLLAQSPTPHVKASGVRVHPTPKSVTVSQQMSRMPRRNTKPELRLRRALHTRGLRYRLHAPLPGRPDLVFTRAKIAIFVDGCFWHRCPEHGCLPKNNREWWREKLAANVRRDRAKDEALAMLGWDVIHIWEHEDPREAAVRVEALWREKTLMTHT